MNNPIAKAILAALSAAYAELTTPEAVEWYRATATQACLILATIAVACYQLIEAYLLIPTEAPLATPAPTSALAIHNIKAVSIPASTAPRSSQAHIFYKR